MALSVERNNDHIRVLSDLSGDVVGALLDEGERVPDEGDPFAAALRRYKQEGHPGELTGPWRRAMATRPVAAGGYAASVLRLLARDLLSCVAAHVTEPETAEPEPALPPNVRPIAGGPAAPIPALELASDGTWRPSTAGAVTTETEIPQRRAHVPSMGSRYPTIRHDEHRIVLPPPPPAASAPAASRAPVRSERATREPAAAATPAPEPAPAVTPTSTAPPEAPHAESVIQAVSDGMEIVAGPFARFQELAAFSKALRELSGVQSVTIRQFVRGFVHLRVRHSSSLDLAAALLTLTDFSPSIVSSTASRIELRVASSDAAPPPQD
ncbi:MAG: hypothetical protein KGN00_06120 [Chloroflexota bacterium]|nr:hypothetical protein [Chloroflexota bacterium]MDE3193248.1 hypothetical protein [Chloroflexota bacterium]